VDDDDLWLEFMVQFIRVCFSNAETVTFNSPQAALRELEQRDPDLLITGDKMPRMTGEELVRRLLAKNVNYPILVLTGHDEAQQWVRKYASRGFNVGFQPKRGVEHELKRSIEKILNPQRDTIEKPVEIAPQPRRTHPFRIVVVHEMEWLKKATELITQNWLKNVDLLSFADGQEAWPELSRLDPDLLITYDRMPGMGGEEIVRRLADRRATFPIIVVSAWEDVTLPWVRQYAGTGVNVKFLNAPFDIETFRKVVAASLKISPDGNHEK